MWRVFSAFGHKAAIPSDNAMRGTVLFDHMRIEGKEIKRLFKMCTIGFLRIGAVASHIQKVEPTSHTDEEHKNMFEKFFSDVTDPVHVF